MICLENLEFNGGSTITIVEARTTLAQVCEIILAVETSLGKDLVSVRTLTPGGTTRRNFVLKTTEYRNCCKIKSFLGHNNLMYIFIKRRIFILRNTIQPQSQSNATPPPPRTRARTHTHARAHTQVSQMLGRSGKPVSHSQRQHRTPCCTLSFNPPHPQLH